MKKYLFGAIAALFALATVAFTIPPKDVTTHFFRYDTGTYNNLASWTYEGVSDPNDCEDGTIVCIVGIDGSYSSDPKDEILAPFLSQFASLEEVSEAPEVTGKKSE